MRMTARPAHDDEQPELYQRFIDLDERFAAYPERAGREIPVVILEPID